MFYKYFKITKKRVAAFLAVTLFIIILQYTVTGSMLAKQYFSTEAGNANSSVIGIIDNEEIIRQKFSFNRKVVLNKFDLSFGSFEREKVGDVLHIQMTDGDNNLVYSTDIDVDEITPNQVYPVEMDHTVTISKNVVCCIKLTCSSEDNPYNIIPTLNTTNRTDPNTYMSTLKMQTRKKCLNISYTYSYRQLLSFIIFVLQFVAIFIICFEHITDYSEVYRKRRIRQKKRQQKEKELLDKNSDKNDINRKKLKQNIKSLNSKKADTKKKNSKKVSFSIRQIVIYCLSEPKVIKGIRILAAVINPLVLFVILEAMNGTLINQKASVWIFSWLLLIAIQSIFYIIIGNMYVSMIAMNFIMFPFGLGNLFVMNVRGTPLLPADIFGLATAAEVASTYTVKFTPAEFVMLPMFIIWIMLLLKIKPKYKKQSLILNIRKRIIPVITSTVIICTLYNTGILKAVGIKDDIWNKVASCQKNGFYMNFFLNLHYLKVSEPAGYSQERVAQIIEDTKKADTSGNSLSESGRNFLSNSDFKTTTSLNGKKPNIILVMNESLADFSQIGDVNFSQDPLPFIHSLRENTVYGIDYVSVFGAGTSNSEFEAMTGNTMSFFPSGCNVYQQFMHDKTFSISSYLNSLGYSCDAIHPSSGNNWNRINTYNSMGFDRFITIDDFENPEYVRYISDKESYKKVIELYEQNKGKGPMFMFDMTIQNHGGYLTNTNWEDPVSVKGTYYNEAKEYLSAIKVSDEAFKYLVEYFEKQDEPTVILMFGDHQPSIEKAFFEDLIGKPQSEWELEDIQKKYAAPFVLWANYDIQEGQNYIIGNNMIENMLLKAAGLELPLYNRFIENISKEIPAMNVNGFMDNSGKWHNYDSGDIPENIAKLLDDYKILQYGYYSDSDKDKMTELFEMK